MATTTRLALPYPIGTDSASGMTQIQALAAALDSVATIGSQGTLAARPTSSGGTPGIVNRIYYATDTGVHYWDTGTGWVAIGSVAANSITTAMLQNNAVTEPIHGPKSVSDRVIGDNVVSKIGTLAARPGASTVSAGVVYYATDVNNAGYRSDGVSTWTRVTPSVPTGGAAGAILSKKTATDFDLQWITPGNAIKFPTQVNIVSTVTETDLVGTQGSGFTIPAGVMGSDRMLDLIIWGDVLNNTAGNAGWDLKVYLGGTAIYVVPNTSYQASSNASLRKGVIKIHLGMQNATNLVDLLIEASMSQATSATTGIGGMRVATSSFAAAMDVGGSNGPVTVDMTVNQNLRVTLTPSASSASLGWKKQFAMATVLG